MKSTNHIEHKVIVVTGGSKGIGYAICNLLRDNGAIVIDASIEAVTCEFESVTAGKIYQKQTDITSEQSVADLFTWIDHYFAGIDVLINNAGVFLFKPLAEISFGEWQHTTRTNLDGTFLCTKECLLRMLPKNQGQIINIGSISGQLPLANNGAYGTSKAAVKMLTQIINQEYGGQGIKASVLILGAVSTELWNSYPGIDKSKMISTEKVASTILYMIEQNGADRMEEICLLPSFRFF